MEKHMKTADLESVEERAEEELTKIETLSEKPEWKDIKVLKGVRSQDADEFLRRASCLSAKTWGFSNWASLDRRA